jgi:hypothetical protein
MKFSSTPAWTFAGKRKGKNSLAGPGPGYYNLKKFTDFKSGGYSLPRAKRSNNEKLKNKVGPGQYNYDYSSFNGNGASLKGKRSTLLK